jgi:hypothetical protein
VHPLLADPFVRARIEEAVAPFVGRLPADELDWMREQLAETLASDDEARAALARARPRVVEESGEVPRGAAVTPIRASRHKGAAG